MTPTKEPIDIGTSSAEPGPAQGNGRPRRESAHLREDAVSLAIPVKVHGSLVSGISAGVAPQAQPFEEQTTTMIVFPQGGVLKMSTAVSAGQVMVLTNLKSRQDAICRAIKVRAYGKDQSYVEVEFTSPQSGYWGVYFPTDGPEVARIAPQPDVAPTSPAQAPAAAPPASPAGPTATSPAGSNAASLIASTAKQVPDVSWAPAASLMPPKANPVEPAAHAEASQAAIAALRLPAPAKLPESSFVSIGAKEDVLQVASATKNSRPNPLAESAMRPADADISAAIDALVSSSTTAVSAGSSSRAVTIERSRETSTGGAYAPSAARASVTATSGADTSAEAPVRVPTQMFGVMLDSASPVAEKASRGNSGKMWMPIGIAAIVAIVAGGAYYYHSYVLAGSSELASVVSTAPVASEQPSITQAPVSESTAASPGDAQGVPDQSSAVQSPDSAAPNGATSDFKAESSSSRMPESSAKPGGFEPFAPRGKASTSSTGVQSASAAPSKPIVAIPSASGALNRHPVIARRSNVASAGTAPSLDAGGNPVAPNGSLPSIAAPTPGLPAPLTSVPSGPVRVGGKILPPRLISSVLPTYPTLAQQAGVKGTVVVDTIIDKDGNVAKTNVISGPELLRQSALSALRQWKYEPSKLNGQPISVEMIVSIQFH
jgi:TonB family protein